MKEVYSTGTGARIDPWKEIANLREQLAEWKARASEAERDTLTLCLRLCLEPTDSHAPETLEVLERWHERTINAAQAATNAAGQDKRIFGVDAEPQSTPAPAAPHADTQETGSATGASVDDSHPASSALVLDADNSQLMRFYGVTTLQELIDAQAHHIERLQAKLPPMRDERPGYVPREG